MLFSMYPNVAIEIDGQLINYPDIFRRVAKNKYFNNSVYLDTYTVRDGQKPEYIAHKLYGNPQYHWVVLLANNILDVYHEWPRNSDDLYKMCEDKYGENSVHGVHHYALASNTEITIDYDKTKFDAGEIVAVTNFTYELKINEEKSEIILLKPEYLKQFVGQFKQLIVK